ncbi:GATA transcription factor 15-like [Quercus lobata]|uniref:GATA-type domain-containing protein n=1 Tax=Quercus lobata TaxID=97700 RepID=A0A7N2RER7_QUELO|nr:GATA transcription factor 15-like [Quercus lobata]
MESKTKSSESEDMNSTLLGGVEELKKSCTDCHTTRTPLWRGGPAGPRSLCNACGIRYRKKRRALLSLDKGETEKCKKNSINRSNKGKVGVRLKLGLMALGREMGLHRSLGKEKQIMRKLKEEEQAAMLLMALSCGCVYN